MITITNKKNLHFTGQLISANKGSKNQLSSLDIKISQPHFYIIREENGKIAAKVQKKDTTDQRHYFKNIKEVNLEKATDIEREIYQSFLEPTVENRNKKRVFLESAV